ncbi:hypothetical protein Pmani_019114 [Petrolisthes manimaculis]|uniref:Uncharacterized protein n=1 Tax=Petrolisthes manimaculis TaxID=1843537 RepID=A0AAE1U612_9EUCA|nr:hypothetical protein Pmani_019114 [Petrolisthes manimaculis]
MELWGRGGWQRYTEEGEGGSKKKLVGDTRFGRATTHDEERAREERSQGIGGEAKNTGRRWAGTEEDTRR